jgi:peptide/nickel transport system permease protein
MWQGLVVLLIVSALTFALLATAGGDAFTALRGDPSITEETIERLRRVYGLDQPLVVRYARWLGGIARGDMGYSFFYQVPVASLLRARLVNTLWLAAVALLLAGGVSLALGAWAARRAGSWVDRLCELVIVVAASTPRLVLALLALVFAAQTSLFAVNAPSSAQAALAATSLARLLLSASVLCVPLLALFLAQTREGVGAALAEDFVRVARSKGLPERVVVLRHALRAALNPLITIFGYSIGFTISGSVIVETVLNWPGLGQLSVVAVRSRDVPLLMGVVLVTASAVLAGNLLADIALRANDPRLRRTGARPDTLALRAATEASAPS